MICIAYTILIYLNMLIEINCRRMRVALSKMKFVKSIRQGKQFCPDLPIKARQGSPDVMTVSDADIYHYYEEDALRR